MKLFRFVLAVFLAFDAFLNILYLMYCYYVGEDLTIFGVTMIVILTILSVFAATILIKAE
jgi:hypothetical protein